MAIGVNEGWKLLNRTIRTQEGYAFVLLLERRKGDTVQEIIEYWGDASIEEIHGKVLVWKNDGNDVKK